MAHVSCESSFDTVKGDVVGIFDVLGVVYVLKENALVLAEMFNCFRGPSVSADTVLLLLWHFLTSGVQYPARLLVVCGRAVRILRGVTEFRKLTGSRVGEA